MMDKMELGGFGIPRVLHQIWYNFREWGREVAPPEKYRHLTDRWLKINPDWNYVLWTESSTEKFLLEFYPELLEKFLGYRRPIQRVDFFRWVALYHFGGVFADMDCVPLRPLHQHPQIINSETKSKAVLVVPSDGWVTNALIIASRRHPAVLKVIDGLPTADPWLFGGPSVVAVFQTTGPSAVRRILKPGPNVIFDEGLLCHTPGTPEQAKEFFEKGFLAQHLGDGSWDFKSALWTDVARIAALVIISLLVLGLGVHFAHRLLRTPSIANDTHPRCKPCDLISITKTK